MASAGQWKEKAQRAAARLSRMREKSEEMLGQVLQTSEVVGTGFMFAFLRGRMGDAEGELNLAGVPVSLGAGIGFHLLGFTGVFGKYAEHAHNLGDGALTEYGVVQGMRLGAQSGASIQGRRISATRYGQYKWGQPTNAFPGGQQHPWAASWQNPAVVQTA